MSVDTDTLRDLAGITQDEEEARGTPRSDELDEQADRGEARTGLPPTGQQTIDGQEVRPPIEEIRVDGTHQLAIDAGGKQPTEVKLSLTGSAKVTGHFRKGDRITGTFEAVVNAYSTKDKVDKQTQIVTEAGAVFGARLTDLTVD